MALRWTSGALVVVAVGAAWFGARAEMFWPIAWIAVALVILAIPVAERRLVSTLTTLLIVFVLAVSWIGGLDHELGLSLGLHVLFLVFVFGLARRSPLDERQLWWLALGVALTSLVALAQTSGGFENLRVAIADVPEAWRERALKRLSTGRAFGTAALPGHFAALQLMVVPILLRAAMRGPRAARFVSAAAVVLALAGVVTSRSVAALVVFAVALLSVWPLRRMRLAPVLTSFAGLATLVALAIALRPDLLDLEPGRLRWINWQAAWLAFSQAPVSGVGLGGVGQAVLAAPLGKANITPYAHNSVLQLVAELGLPGIALVGVAAWLLGRMIRVGMRSELALALSVLLVPLHNLLDFSLYVPEVAIPWAALAGTLAARTRPLEIPRAVPSWLLLPALVTGALATTLDWRCESDAVRARRQPVEQQARALLDAARWRPWAVDPVQEAAAAGFHGGVPDDDIRTIAGMLAERSWVRPRSASWAEAMARLSIRLGQRGEAFAWAREACRRNPWRDDLKRLEDECRPAN